MATITTGTVGTGVLVATGAGTALALATASVALVGAVETAYGLAVSANSMNQMEEDWGKYQASTEGRPNTQIQYPGNDPSKSPSPEWEWRGNGEPGSSQGSWYNPTTKESLHPDLNHPGSIGPHWDYTAPDGTKFRLNPDGSLIPK